jgi:hypothetical protein
MTNKQLNRRIVERTICGAWRARGAPPPMSTKKEEVSLGVGSKPPPWAKLDDDAQLELTQVFARRLHTRWAKAESAVLDDQNIAAATNALLLVAKDFMLTVLEHIPPERAKIAIDPIRKNLDIVLLSQRGMTDEMYFNRPYAGFWRVREPPLADRRLPDYRAKFAGNIDGPEGEID